MVRRLLWPIAILLAVGACSDVAAPPSEHTVLASVVSPSTASPEVRTLRQSPTAPPLEAYQVSFWAKRQKQTTVSVNYRPAEGQSLGDPFLRFRIPKRGLVAGAGGVALQKRDSVFMTLTIDPVNFSVEFQPAGVRFSKGSAAQLTMWYDHANPDLNGDGVVDAADEKLKRQLSIWYQPTERDGWRQVSSRNHAMKQWVAAALYHFSEYAVSW